MNWGQYSTFEKGGFHVDKEGSDGVEVKNSVENSAKFTRSLTIFKALDRLDIIKECKERNVDVISVISFFKLEPHFPTLYVCTKIHVNV